MDFYERQIAVLNEDCRRLRRKQRIIPYLRVIFFLLIISFLYFLFNTPGLLFGCCFLLSLLGFVVTGIRGIRLNRQYARFEMHIKIISNEIKALKGDYSAYDTGIEYIDFDHPYTYDLDIFGQHSLFNFLDRTSTRFGKHRLADYLMKSIDYSDKLNLRQEAVKELSGKNMTLR